MNHEEEMRRIRQRQQEELDRIAREVASERKKKEPKEDGSATIHQKQPKKKPGTLSKPPGGGYNPMQPWTASQRGGGYKYVHLMVCI